jgi:hypothetical protein
LPRLASIAPISFPSEKSRFKTYLPFGSYARTETTYHCDTFLQTQKARIWASLEVIAQTLVCINERQDASVLRPATIASAKTGKDQSVSNTHRFELYANITTPRNDPRPRIQQIIVVESKSSALHIRQILDQPRPLRFPPQRLARPLARSRHILHRSISEEHPEVLTGLFSRD